ncbi:hypothetical protein, partial [Komagataeibacter europaeus]|uniref:hypothetical protein n=1 Tax=Komagataeibacter europaeus TaxID=33995 RepID=UPI001955456C
MATNISIKGTKPYTPNTDALQILINKQVYTNFQGFQFQRSMEQVPSTFQMEFDVPPFLYPLKRRVP